LLYIVRYCFFNNNFISKCVQIKRQWRSQLHKADNTAGVYWWKLCFARIMEEHVLSHDCIITGAVSEQERTLSRCTSHEVKSLRDLWGWTPGFTSTHTKRNSGERTIYQATETLTVKPKLNESTTKTWVCNYWKLWQQRCRRYIMNDFVKILKNLSTSREQFC